jgi:NADH:ubiquinone oxidoreductase subunit 6 (subunit J)
MLVKFLKIVGFYCIGVGFCIPALLSAYFEYPWRGWWDSNETWFVLLSLVSTFFFFSSFYFLELGYWKQIILYISMIGFVFFTIPDIQMYYGNLSSTEKLEPVYSNFAIVILGLNASLLGYLIAEKNKYLSSFVARKLENPKQ